jgi:hypothetical protein
MLILPGRIMGKRNPPWIKFLSASASDTDATTYTFSSVNLDPGRPFRQGRDHYVLAIHGEDAADAFTVSTATIAGVAASEIFETPSTTTTTCTAIYILTSQGVGGVSSGDIVITFSEAVTGCGYGLWCVGGLRPLHSVNAGASSNSDFTGASTLGRQTAQRGDVMVWATTCVGGEDATFTGGSCFPQSLASGDYNNSSAEFDYAGVGWVHGQHGCGLHGGTNVSWSGTGEGTLIWVRLRPYALTDSPAAFTSVTV